MRKHKSALIAIAVLGTATLALTACSRGSSGSSGTPATGASASKNAVIIIRPWGSSLTSAR